MGAAGMTAAGYPGAACGLGCAVAGTGYAGAQYWPTVGACCCAGGTAAGAPCLGGDAVVDMPAPGRI